MPNILTCALVAHTLVTCQPSVHTGLEQVLQNSTSLTPQQLLEGIPVDPDFQDVGLDDGNYVSSPGCPSAINGYPWVKYGSSPKCYLAGFRGPCPFNMKLNYSPISGEEYGYCQCDCFHNDPDTPFEYFCNKHEIEGGTNAFWEAWAFYEPTESCYKLFSQGPCKAKEWFKLDKTSNKGVCVTRRCPYSLDENRPSFYSSGDGACHFLQEECSPTISQSLVNGTAGVLVSHFRYAFSKEKWVPECLRFDTICESEKTCFNPRPYIPFNTAHNVQASECRKPQVFSAPLQMCLQPFKLKPGRSIG